MWVFGPEAPYERGGDAGNVAFPCGYTIRAGGEIGFGRNAIAPSPVGVEGLSGGEGTQPRF